MLKKGKPYSERTDIEKIVANWVKTKGLVSRDEWSSAVIRAAITVELSANLVVRKEFQEARNMDSEFVNSLLKWANGVRGKLDRLIMPICKGNDKYDKFKLIKEKIIKINDKRNDIVHGGQFGSEKLARRIVKDAYEPVP